MILSVIYDILVNPSLKNGRSHNGNKLDVSGDKVFYQDEL